MAIKVNGTTAIDDSRGLTNIASIDATTATAITNAGVGGGGSTFEATASGALANGDLVVLNSDGTVSIVEGTSFTQSVGTPTIYETGATGFVDACYDSNSDRVVVVYHDEDNSYYGTAAVGTVSGTSISFGTPVIFYSGVAYPAVAYDTNAQKVVIAWRAGGNSGRARVGTVSGTSISFGSENTWQSDNVADVGLTYDSNAQKVVVVYRDSSNSSKGTARVGTVSGTSISFGSASAFSSGRANLLSPSTITYDSDAQKVIVGYQDDANLDYGTAVVGTVSGTSISFGTPVVFKSSATTSIGMAYDESSQRAVIALSSSGAGKVTAGTVSGTSISFGAEYDLGTASLNDINVVYHPPSQSVIITYDQSGGKLEVGTVSGSVVSLSNAISFESGSVNYTRPVYDSGSKRIVIAYEDDSNGDRGTAVVFTPTFTDTNLTSNNYKGISDGAYSDSAIATIQSFGAVDDAQSGLTAGQAYYVQYDGTLDTTPGDPSVFAGTAVSATKIIVKG